MYSTLRIDELQFFEPLVSFLSETTHTTTIEILRAISKMVKSEESFIERNEISFEDSMIALFLRADGEEALLSLLESETPDISKKAKKLLKKINRIQEGSDEPIVLLDLGEDISD